MNKEEFIQFVAKNLKYHLPSDFNSYQIEVNHMRLTISESNSSYDFILIQTFLFKKSFIFTDSSIILDSLNDSKRLLFTGNVLRGVFVREVKPCFYPACTIY